MQQRNKITEGVIWKEVLIFFIPILISGVFQHLYTLVDGIIVGRYLGDVAFSAVGGSASKVIVLLINFFVGVSTGITAYTSRYYGKKDMKSIWSIIYNGLGIFIFLGIILSIVGLIFAPNLLQSMSTPVESMEYATTYLRTFLFGLVFCISYNSLAGIMRAIGDAKTPFYVLLFCSIINITLDIVFVVLFNMGVLGVALATLIAQGTSAIILTFILFKKLPNKPSTFKVDWVVIKEICEIGIPVGIQSIMYSLSNILVQSTVNTFGYISVTAWVAYLKIDTIVDLFISSLSGTVITFVGQNYGAEKIDRVKQSVLQIILISYIIATIIIVIMVFNRYSLMSLFTETEEVVLLGGQLMFIIMPMYLLGIPYQMFAQALRGLGKTFLPMMFTLVGIVGIRVIWVKFIFPTNPTIQFLGLCYPISSFIMTIVFTIYYLKVIRKI